MAKREFGSPLFTEAPSGSGAAPDPASRYFSFSASPRRVSRSYSRFVRGMKLVLPAAAALLVTLVIAWPQIDWNQPPTTTGLLNIKPEDAENLSMQNARYVGTDARDRPFTITADAARQIAPQTQQVALERPAADMTLADGSWVAVSAEQGLFDREAGTLELAGSVSLYQDEGYELHSDAARIDLKTGTAEGGRPVSGHGPAGIISSQGFRVLDQGRTVIFTGESSLLIRPDKIGSRSE